MTAFPVLLTKSVNSKIIEDGFIRNGIIDKVSKEVHDLDMIMNTIQQKTSCEEMNLILSFFPICYNEFIKNEMVSKATYKIYKFLLYIDDNKNIVYRDAGINQEHLQCCKLLNSEYQQELCIKNILESDLKKQKSIDKKKKIQSFIICIFSICITCFFNSI